MTYFVLSCTANPEKDEIIELFGAIREGSLSQKKDSRKLDVRTIFSGMVTWIW